MAVSYAGYCFESAAQAAEYANSFAGLAAGDLVLESVDVAGSVLTFNFSDFEGATVGTGAVSASLETCAALGPLIATGTGITVAESAALAFAVVAVWVAAFVFAAMRRGLEV
jgi:hypothetical protein